MYRLRMCFRSEKDDLLPRIFLLIILFIELPSIQSQNNLHIQCAKPEDCLEIKNCPARCERCTRLETDCQNSMLTKIPTEVLLDSTILFLLKDNYIGNLDENSFAGTNPEKLVKLDLSKNQIHYLNKNALQPLKNLNMLHLDHNYLVEINPYAIRYQPFLDFLSLNYNHGLSLPNDNNPGLYSPPLKTLEFNHCNVTKLNPRIFEGIPNIEKIDLSYNRIVIFEQQTFAELKYLKNLKLEGNPLDCGYVANSLDELCARNICVTFTCSHEPHGPIRNCTDLPDPTVTPITPTTPTPPTCIEIHPVFIWLIIILLISILLIFFYWTICNKFNLQQHSSHRHHHHHNHHNHEDNCHNRPLPCPENVIQSSATSRVTFAVERTPPEILNSGQTISSSETKSPQPLKSCISTPL